MTEQDISDIAEVIPEVNAPSYTLYHGDCLVEMDKIPDKSVDMVLCDLPYGTTKCKWDVIIPLEQLWRRYKRICKTESAIVLTASQPFTSILLLSNINGFSHELIWDKGRGSEPALAKLRPQKSHESVLVFSPTGKNPKYYPQMIKRDNPVTKKGNYSNDGQGIISGSGVIEKEYTHRYPTSVIKVTNSNQSGKSHPTQKPVALLEYLIRTYTHKGMTILDNTMGSGSTGVACANTGRNFIGIELYPLPDRPIDKRENPNYFFDAEKRIAEAYARPRQIQLGDMTA